MHLIYLCSTLGLIVFNMTGLTAFATRFFPAQASARLLAVSGLALITFAIEHFVGLGSLAWLWPLTTASAAWAIYRKRQEREEKRFWEGELVFFLGFIYGLAWRFAFPNIDSSSEHLTDLYFISNYLPGLSLPPPDHWLAGDVFDFYYAFQHYAAALLGRLFGLQAGMAMNFSWALLIAFLVTLSWEIASHFIRSRGLRVALVTTLLLGGNGLSPLMPLMILDDDSTDHTAAAANRIWESTRFLGMYDDRVNTALGRAVAGLPKTAVTDQHIELPLETVAYLTHLGDYHPPLGGFVLLLWTLALSLDIVRRPTGSVADHSSVKPQWASSSNLSSLALGLTPALVLVTNTWVFPLQVLLLISWLVFRHNNQARERQFLALGALLSGALIYPFLSHFAPAALATPIRWVKLDDHTPPLYFIALHWPLLLLIVCGLWLSRRERWAGWLALSLGGLLLMSEFIYVDDPMDGKYERFNTTLKWWSWLWPAGLVGLGSAVLGHGGKTIKALVSLTLAALMVYALPMTGYWLAADKPNVGQLAGNGWLKQDATLSSMLEFLKNSPDGVVLESIEQGAYSSTSALALNAGKGVLLGWPDHVTQWRGAPAYISVRRAAIQSFYHGEMENPTGWLNQHQVRYIVWSLADERRSPQLRERIHGQIAPNYHWRAFYRDGEGEAGIWESRHTR